MTEENITLEMITTWSKQLDYCIEKQEKLSDWEIDFMSSIYKDFNEKRELSIRQSFKLNEIYNKI